MIKRFNVYFTVLVIAVLVFSSCTYNSEEDLYPVIEPPMEEVISYTSDILPIIETNCYVCHSAAAMTAGIVLEGYDNLVIRVENGSLMGTIRHDEGWSAMPQGASKLSDSQISKLEKWIEQDYPNN